MQISDEIRNSHRSLSTAAEHFLDYILEVPERVRQFDHISAGLPRWTRTYATTQMTWPTFIDQEKVRQITRATVGVARLIKSVPERIFKHDAQKICDFYGYESGDLVELLLEPPNGIDSAMARVDFIDSEVGFKCCEVNMTPNVGGWECQFWEQTYLEHPVVKEFAAQHDLKPSHRNPLRTLTAQIVEESTASGICDGRELNVVIVSIKLPVPEGAQRIAQEMFSGYLKDVGSGLNGTVTICAGADGLSMKAGYLYCHGRRVHAVVGYRPDDVPPSVYWCHKAGTICLYNGPLIKVLVDKRNLSLLSEYEDSDLFNEEERSIIRDHIPWSRIVAEGKTNYHGESVSLPSFILAHREQLVLKLGDSYGGKDVYIGAVTPEEKWKPAVDNAIAEGNWVIQEYVPSRPFLYSCGEGEPQVQNLVWGMFCFGNSYGGGYIRMLPQGTKDGIVNSGRGAIESPVIEV